MILGFSGWPGVGKSVLVGHILEALPNYAKLSFGDFLKEEASEVFGYPLEWNYSQEGKQNLVEVTNWPYPMGRSIKSVTVREILQLFGTHLCEKDPLCLVSRAKIAMRGRKRIIFDDLRDPLEADFIRSIGGHLLRIEPHDDWKPTEASSHPREHLLDKYKGWDSLLYPKFGALKTFSIQVVEWIRDHE